MVFNCWLVSLLIQLTGAVLERHKAAELDELFKKVKQKIADDQTSTYVFCDI